MLSIGQNNSALEYERQIREIETEIGSEGYYGLCSVHGAHRLNMELDQSLFGLHVHSCIHWLRPQLPSSPAFGFIYEGAIGQPRYTT
jgi:hypothetical protein